MEDKETSKEIKGCPQGKVREFGNNSIKFLTALMSLYKSSMQEILKVQDPKPSNSISRKTALTNTSFCF